MKKMKKILVIIMCVLLFTAVFTACSNNDDAPAATTTTTTTTEPTSGEPVVIKYLTITWNDLAADSPGNERIRGVILEKLNIDVQLSILQKPDNAAERINLIIAGGEKYDVMDIGDNRGFYKELVSQNYLLSLDDLLESEGQDILDIINPETWNFLRIEGKIYALPYEAPQCINNVILRKDIMDKYDVAIPQTIDEFEQNIIMMMEKESTNGYVLYWDNIDATFSGSFMPVASNFPENDTNYLTADGKIEPTFTQEGYKDYLEVMNRFYEDGIIAKDFITMKYEEAGNLVNAGQYIAAHLWAATNHQLAINYWGNTIEGLDLESMPPLKGNIEGSYPKAQLTSDLYVFPSTCSNPEKTMELANYLGGTMEGYSLARYGIEGEDYFTLGTDGDFLLLDSSKTSIYAPEDQYLAAFRLCVPVGLADYCTMQGNQKWIAKVAGYKTTAGPDYGILYDFDKMESKDNITELRDMIIQERIKVILGERPASDWDEIIDEWRSKGGDTYIDDMTKQYNEKKD